MTFEKFYRAALELCCDFCDFVVIVCGAEADALHFLAYAP